jgi:hypothetical protein
MDLEVRPVPALGGKLVDPIRVTTEVFRSAQTLARGLSHTPLVSI